MGNKNTCLFYKSANKTSDTPDVNVNTLISPTSPALTLNSNAISEALANTAQAAVSDSPSKNPVLTGAENSDTIPDNVVPDVNFDGVMGRTGGKGSKDSTEGIHPGLIGGGVALVGGGLLIAYLEAQKAKRRRRKERMRNMNTNIANV